MKRDKGFTLIEIIVSIALVGIILVGILPVMAQGLIFLNKTKEITQDVFSAQQSMELAIESAKDHTSGLTPKKATLFPGYNIEVPYYEVVTIYENKKYVTMVSEARPAEYEALSVTGVKAIANNDATLKAVPSGSDNRIDGKHDVVIHPDFYRNIYQWYVSKPGYNIPYPASGTTIPEAEVGTLYPVFPYDYQALPLGYDVKYLSDLSTFAGRHVVFTATPASVKGKLGQLVFSSPILVVGYPDISKLLLHLDASLIDVSNNNEVDTGTNILLKSWINQIAKTNKFQGSNSERPKVMTNPPKKDFSGRFVDFEANNLLSVNGFNALQNKNLFVFAVVRGNANGFITHNGVRLNATNPADGVTDNDIIQIGSNWKIVKTNYTSDSDEQFKKMSIGGKDIDIAEVMMCNNLSETEVNKVIEYLKNKYKIYVETNDIVSLHDLEHEIFKGDVYTLPSSVLATFKDGSTRYVAVTWPDLTYAPLGVVDTSTVKTFIFTGNSLDNPANKVSLRVKIKPILKFTSLTINAVAQPIAIGDHPKLTYTYLPAIGTVESVKWQSSEPSVATIGSNTGDLVAIKKGKTTITLTINGINVAAYELNVGSGMLPVSDGLVLHLSASDSANFEIASDKIKTWKDLSGKNNDFAQSSSDKQPKWLNGFVQFAGDDYLVKSGDLSKVEFFTKKGTNFTTFIVVQASNQTDPWGGYISNYTDDGTSYLLGRSNGNYFEHVVNNSSDHIEWQANDGLNLFATTNNSGALSSWINGGSKITKNYGNGSSNGNRFLIGAGRGGADNYLNGSIGEIIVYDRVLNEVEISTMNLYLSNKYFKRQWEFDVAGDFVGSPAVYNDVNNVKIENGVLSGTIIAIDPRISSTNNLNLQLGNSKKIKIRLKNQSESTKAQIYFDTVASPGLGEDKVVTFDIQKNSGFVEYTVDFSGNVKWTGVLKSLRIDPAMSVTTGSFEIDYIKITE